MIASLKENWFKAILVTVTISIVTTYAFSQFIKVKEHNLDVMTAIRLCAGSNFNQEGVEACADAAKKQYIFSYPPSKSQK